MPESLHPCIIRTAENGDLLVQAPHRYVRRVKLLEAELQPDGLWRVPVHRRFGLDKLINPEPLRQRPKLTPPKRVAAYVPPSPEEVDAWFDTLPSIAGVTITRPTSLTMGFRLKRHSDSAVSLLKSLPGRTWVPNHGAWEVRISTHRQLTAISQMMELLEDAVADRSTTRPKAIVEMVFSISDCPDLNTPVLIDGQWIVFEEASSMFRLHEGHGRQERRLVPHVGTYGCNFKGRPAAPNEIPTGSR